jgi:cytochrome-b5 reductase
VELTFTKTEPQLWTNYGSLERRKITELEMLQFDYNIAVQQPINHDSYALVLEPRGKFLIRTPLGHHLSLTVRLENYGEIMRSYTPLPVGYLPLAEAASTSPCSIALLVKSYEFGLLSKTITRPLPMDVALTVSQPKGDFALTKLRNHSRIALLAAGSGITPMLGLIDYLLLRSSNKV